MNYYEILNVDINADTDTIRKAYRKLIKIHHPDLNADDRQKAEEITKQLNEAYAVLKNPEQRRAYDRQLVEEEEYTAEEIFTVESDLQNVKGTVLGVLIYAFVLFGLPRVFDILYGIPGAGDWLYLVTQYPQGTMLVQTFICALFGRIFAPFILNMIDYGERMWAGKAVFLLLLVWCVICVVEDTRMYGLYVWTVAGALIQLFFAYRLWRMN